MTLHTPQILAGHCREPTSPAEAEVSGFRSRLDSELPGSALPARDGRGGLLATGAGRAGLPVFEDASGRGGAGRARPGWTGLNPAGPGRGGPDRAERVTILPAASFVLKISDTSSKPIPQSFITLFPHRYLSTLYTHNTYIICKFPNRSVKRV